MGFFDAIGSIGKKISHSIIGAGKKLTRTIGDIGKKAGKLALTGLDKGIQGLQIGAQYIDNIPVLGTALSFVPFEGAVINSIDALNTVRQMVKGEKKFNSETMGDLGMNVLMGGLSAVGGAGEIKALKAGYKTAQLGKMAGLGLGESLRTGGRVALEGYYPGIQGVASTIKNVGVASKSGLNRVGKGVAQTAGQIIKGII